MTQQESQADMLRRLAAAADKHGQHIYTHGRDSNAAKANEAWHKAASPELVIGLLDRIAELEAKQPAPGWKLVPETLTDEMKREFMDLLMDGIDIYVNRHDQIEVQTDAPRRIWKQVLSLAPAFKAQEAIHKGQKCGALTDEQIDAIFSQQPDGAQGFLKSWGYRNFAKDLLRYAGAKPAIDPQALMELVKKFAAAVAHNLLRQLNGKIEVAHEVVAAREKILAMVAPFPPTIAPQSLTEEQMRSQILDDLFPHGITKEDLKIITSVIRATETTHGIGTAP